MSKTPFVKSMIEMAATVEEAEDIHCASAVIAAETMLLEELQKHMDEKMHNISKSMDDAVKNGNSK